MRFARIVVPILLLAVFTILRVADRPVTDVANDFEHLTPFLLSGFLLSLFLAWNNQSLLRSAFAFTSALKRIQIPMPTRPARLGMGSIVFSRNY